MREDFHIVDPKYTPGKGVSSVHFRLVRDGKEFCLYNLDLMEVREIIARLKTVEEGLARNHRNEA